jgi:hypothetical protein
MEYPEVIVPLLLTLKIAGTATRRAIAIPITKTRAVRVTGHHRDNGPYTSGAAGGRAAWDFEGEEVSAAG